MSYYLTVVDQGLKVKKDISDELRKLYDENKVYLFWHWKNGFVSFDEGYLRRDEDFFQDLLALKSIGVRGDMTAQGEVGEHYKYVINSRAVKEYYGTVRFPKRPARVIKGEMDLR